MRVTSRAHTHYVIASLFSFFPCSLIDKPHAITLKIFNNFAWAHIILSNPIQLQCTTILHGIEINLSQKWNLLNGINSNDHNACQALVLRFVRSIACSFVHSLDYLLSNVQCACHIWLLFQLKWCDTCSYTMQTVFEWYASKTYLLLLINTVYTACMVYSVCVLANSITHT